MKKITGILAAAGIIASLFTGCGNGDTATSAISAEGSTSMEKVMGYLSEGYAEKNKTVKISYNPTGSGAGIKSVSDGSCDIGISSRNLTDEEKVDLNETVIAADGIAIIVNRENKIDNLSVEQLSKIYTGEITNWQEVGGENRPTVAIGREAASGTRDGFETITDTVGKCKYTQELTSSGDVIQTVSGNPNAIGYASLASVKDSVKILSIENIKPSKETIRNKTYKIQRDFIFVTRKDKKLSEAAQAFFDFAASADADTLIEKAGAIPPGY